MRWWSAAAQWRNWPLQVKLGMVLVVPVIGAGALGVLRVQNDVQFAEEYAGIQHIVDLRAQLLTTLTALQNERNEAVRQGRDLGKLARTTDAEISETSDAVGRMPELGQDATQRYRFVTDSLSALPEARRRGADGDLVLDAYNSVTSAVLGFDRALVGRFPDEELTNVSIALNELLTAHEQVAIQQAAGLVAARAGTISEAERSLLVESDTRLEDNLGDFRAVAPEDIRLQYETTVTGPEINKREPMVRSARVPTTEKPPFTAREWDASFNTTSGLMLDVTRSAADRLRAESAALADKYSNRAIIASLLLLLMVAARRRRQRRARPPPGALGPAAARHRARRGEQAAARGGGEHPRGRGGEGHDRPGAAAHHRGVRPAGQGLRRGARPGGALGGRGGGPAQQPRPHLHQPLAPQPGPRRAAAAADGTAGAEGRTTRPSCRTCSRSTTSPPGCGATTRT